MARGKKQNGRRRARGNGGRSDDPVSGSVIARPLTRTTLKASRSYETPLTKAAADQGYGLSFVLNSVASAGDLTVFFDQYRILSIDLLFVLKNLAANDSYPIMFIAPDYDDATAPGAINTILEYDSMRVVNFNVARTTFKFRLRPSATLAAFQGAGVTGVAPVRSPWLDCNTVLVDHFGVKMWIENYNTVGTPSALIQCIVRLNYECAATR